MSDIAVRVDNLSKQYFIGARKDHHDTFRDHIVHGLRGFFARKGKASSNGVKGVAATKDEPSSNPTSIWALKDVSFEIKRGEVVGFIGRNGAGKSTLLKVLARITEPTIGRVELHGRVGSLLEVGTGFHPELSGRENVYLNGAILGMSRVEIDRKFDEIVAFAEVDKFIDTPVKRYSSGMYVRLAFAVAAHLEPEILIVDEVLAVGDILFQQKCLGKMNSIAAEGRTVLFVSHNLNAVHTLCEKAVVLASGEVDRVCSAQEGITRYLRSISEKQFSSFGRSADGSVIMHSVRAIQDGGDVGVVSCAQPFFVKLEYEICRPIPGSRFAVMFSNEKGEMIFGTCDYDDPTHETLNRGIGRFTSTVAIPANLLKTGVIYGSVYIDVKNVRKIHSIENALQLQVVDPRLTAESERHIRGGVVAPLLQWQIAPLQKKETYELEGSRSSAEA